MDKKRFYSLLYIAAVVIAILIDMGTVFEGGESLLCKALVWLALGLIIIGGIGLLIKWGREFWQDYKRMAEEAKRKQNKPVDYTPLAGGKTKKRIDFRV